MKNNKQLPNKTIKLLQQVKRAILKEPKQFWMKHWFKQSHDIPNCRTAACIGGWLYTFTNSRKKPSSGVKCLSKIIGVIDYDGNGNSKTTNFDGSSGVIADTMCELGIKNYDKLVNFAYWPIQFAKIHEEGTPEYAQQAADRIDHFIKTDGQE